MTIFIIVAAIVYSSLTSKYTTTVLVQQVTGPAV